MAQIAPYGTDVDDDVDLKLGTVRGIGAIKDSQNISPAIAGINGKNPGSVKLTPKDEGPPLAWRLSDSVSVGRLGDEGADFVLGDGGFLFASDGELEETYGEFFPGQRGAIGFDFGINASPDGPFLGGPILR